MKDLTLDVANFRTRRQSSEEEALTAMVSASPDRFWALMESLIQDGYLPTESILVISGGPGSSELTVKEGNRRVAALKLIRGLLDGGLVQIPESIKRSMDDLDDAWAKENEEVPCVVYMPSESDIVDRIVTLAHGKGEKAGRDQWNAVARARHNRDAQGGSEPGLDLLEKYLESGRLVASRVAQWSGDYPLSVLEEAMKRLAPRLDLRSARELADTYPDVPHREELEQIITAVGTKKVVFPTIRARHRDFALDYGIPAQPEAGATGVPETTAPPEVSPGVTPSAPSHPKAVSATDPRHVKALLRRFSPRGSNREKLVTLRDEAKKLNVADTPHAFCFVLRSMFEVSAKAYCNDHAATGGPSFHKADGSERALVDVLRDITGHLTKNKKDKTMVKELHGAMTELGQPDRLLSVTSMNQLIHNPRFSVQVGDVCIAVGNVFPLLEAMNA